MFKVGKLLYGVFYAVAPGHGRPLYPVSQDGVIVAYFTDKEVADVFAEELNARAPRRA